MAKHNNPLVVTNNLLLNLDFRNIKRVASTFGSNNLVQNPTYNASTWINAYPANSTISTGIDAPDGSNTAIRLSCTTGGNSLLRVNFTPFTPNGTDVYVISFWVRKISGSVSTAGQLWADMADLTPSVNYLPNLIDGEWVRISNTNTASAASKGFIDLLSDNTNNYTLDFWGVKIENASANNTDYPIKTTVGDYTFDLYHPQFITLNNDSITFTRNDVAPKWGAAMRTVGTGALTSSNFLYNDHTWEVWFRINDRRPTGLPTYETTSTVAMYSGYHAGIYYDATGIYYVIWDGSTAATVVTCTVGASGAQINEGSWYQLAITRAGNVFTPYINGVAVSGGSTRATSVLAGVSNNIWLGGMANLASGAGDFLNYAKNTVANMKMYNRALSATEINQNFNALRGRFGI